MPTSLPADVAKLYFHLVLCFKALADLQAWLDQDA